MQTLYRARNLSKKWTFASRGRAVTDKQLKKIPNVDVILMSEIKDSTLNVQ
jgi:hypothetical protein